MGTYSITYHVDTMEDLLSFLEKNKDRIAGGDSKKAPGRPKKADKAPEDDDLNDGIDDLGDGLGDDDDLLGDGPEEKKEEKPKEEATLENIRAMVSTKSLDPAKKAKIKALLQKCGVESATKLPAAKYKAFYERLKQI